MRVIGEVERGKGGGAESQRKNVIYKKEHLGLKSRIITAVELMLA